MDEAGVLWVDLTLPKNLKKILSAGPGYPGSQFTIAERPAQSEDSPAQPVDHHDFRAAQLRHDEPRGGKEACAHHADDNQDGGRKQADFPFEGVVAVELILHSNIL